VFCNSVAANCKEPLIWQFSHFRGFDLKVLLWPLEGWSLRLQKRHFSYRGSPSRVYSDIFWGWWCLWVQIAMYWNIYRCEINFWKSSWRTYIMACNTIVAPDEPMPTLWVNIKRLNLQEDYIVTANTFCIVISWWKIIRMIQERSPSCAKAAQVIQVQYFRRLDHELVACIARSVLVMAVSTPVAIRRLWLR